MEKLSSVLSRIPIYQSMAEKNFPNGTEGRCEVCGKKRHCTTSEIAVWMKKGFPRHCGRMITIDNPWITRPTKEK